MELKNNTFSVVLFNYTENMSNQILLYFKFYAGACPISMFRNENKTVCYLNFNTFEEAEKCLLVTNKFAFIYLDIYTFVFNTIFLKCAVKDNKKKNQKEYVLKNVLYEKSKELNKQTSTVAFFGELEMLYLKEKKFLEIMALKKKFHCRIYGLKHFSTSLVISGSLKNITQTKEFICDLFKDKTSLEIVPNHDKNVHLYFMKNLKSTMNGCDCVIIVKNSSNENIFSRLRNFENFDPPYYYHFYGTTDGIEQIKMKITLIKHDLDEENICLNNQLDPRNFLITFDDLDNSIKKDTSKYARIKLNKESSQCFFEKFQNIFKEIAYNLGLKFKIFLEKNSQITFFVYGDSNQKIKEAKSKILTLLKDKT